MVKLFTHMPLLLLNVFIMCSLSAHVQKSILLLYTAMLLIILDDP